MYDAELIDLGDYIFSGEGANGQSFDNKADSKLMVKLYNASMNPELVKEEVETARKVFEAGIPSPEPGALVTDGQGRLGIKFRRLEGKVSYARAIGNDPSTVEAYAAQFAKLCQKLHSTEVSRDDFPDVKEQYIRMLDSNTWFSEREKEIVEEVILGTPDTDTAIHGDLSFGNVVEVGQTPYFIDLGEFAVGNPLFDLGMLSIVCLYNDEAFTKEAFHMDNATARKFWEAFVPVYFEGRYTPAEAEEIVRPYAAVKLLLIERNCGCRMDRFHKLIY